MLPSSAFRGPPDGDRSAKAVASASVQQPPTRQARNVLVTGFALGFARTETFAGRGSRPLVW
jgi:hypothetical protein